MNQELKITDVDIIAFDADDTLWHNEGLFYSTQDRFKQILSKYNSEEWIGQKLFETEIRNIQHFGYGVKGFTLSMVETAIELSDGQVTAAEIQSIIEMGREMMRAPVELLEGEAGATIAEIMAATNWQQHTVRGALAGSITKKLGRTLTSVKVEGRGRVYRIAKPSA